MTGVANTGTLRAGCATVEITPPVGVELSGWPFGPSVGVLQPIAAQALYFDDGTTRQIMISADVIAFDTPYADDIRAAIATACELPADNVMLAATHTHSAPATVRLRNWGTKDPSYLGELKTLLCESAQQATAAAAPARVGWGQAFVHGLAVNRHDPDGPTDPEVGLIRVDDVDDNPIAAVITFGCHPVNLHSYRNLIAPDFPGYTRRRLYERVDEKLTVLFFSSPSGDQNPANFRWQDPSEAAARETGEKLADGLLDAFNRIVTSESPVLGVTVQTIQLPLEALPESSILEEHLEQWRPRLGQREAAAETAPAALAEARTEIEWAEEALTTKRADREVSEIEICVQAFRIGDTLVVGVPAEVFVDVGSELRNCSPYYHTLPVTHANGTVGYIATRDAFEAEVYETHRAPKYYGLYKYLPHVGDVFVEGMRTLFARIPHDHRDRSRERNVRSRELRQQALELVVGGCQAHKKPRNLELGLPAFIERAAGAHFWDVDGNEYIDYLLSYGPIVVGHNDPAVNAAVSRQMQKGTIFDLEFPEQLQLTEKLIELIPCAEMAVYFIGGSGATSGAIAMARTHTGREKVVRSGYHGWHPWTQPGRNGVPACYQELTIEVPYNDLDQLAAKFDENRNAVAAVIIEAVRDNGPDAGYFDGVRRLADEHGAVFVLDEVKTGFRFALGGAQEYFGIQPDLATFGKAMCNGYPGSVVVGRREILAARADTYMGATFHADAVSVAAALATITELEKRDGIAHQWRLGKQLIAGLQRIFNDAGVGLEIHGFPCLASVAAAAPHDTRLRDRFLDCLITEGVYLTSHPWFLSLAHTQADIDLSLTKAESAIRCAMR